MIVDASSIIRAVKEDEMRKVAGASTIPLAKFEIGNAIWKDVHLRGLYSAEDAGKLLEVILGLVDLMEVVEPDYSLALKVAVERGITFYDASYVAAAVQRGTKLVTEDAELRRRVRGLVESVSLGDL